MTKDLTKFFSPHSIAVIGVSRSSEKLGEIVLKNIIDSNFSGKIYPINPHIESINNLKCYKDVSSLPVVPDLAVIAIPATYILQELIEIGEKGIKNVVIYAAGFKETGSEGEILERQLFETAEKYKMNILGPNCLGFVNNPAPLNATFASAPSQIGNLRFITQSGALAASLFDYCKLHQLNFSHFITLGNKTVLNENDILKYFQKLPPAKTTQKGLSSVYPIGLYLESIHDGQEFLRITKQISKTNPIFILKPGKTPQGAAAMQSHTGAIATEDSVLDAAFIQAGIIRCHTLEDFFDLSKAFAWENAPLGPNIAIISNAGGPAVVSADATAASGLKLAEFDTETKKQLSQILPGYASTLNPIDVLGDALASRYAQAIEIMLQQKHVHALLIILTPQIMTQIEKTAEAIGILAKRYSKPVFCSFIGGSLISQGEQKLNEYKIPSFHFPERAIFAISAMWSYANYQQQKEKNIIQRSIQKFSDKINILLAKHLNQKSLSNFDANNLISKLNFSSPATEQLSSLNEAALFSQRNGYPVVLKLSAPGLIHKKRVGGVIIDITDEKILKKSWEQITQTLKQLQPKFQSEIKIQIQKQIPEGLEVIIGIKHDIVFGPVLLFGSGGNMAEIIDDKNLYILPIDLNATKHLVEKSKIFQYLKDYPKSLEKLYQSIFNFAKLAENFPQIREMEINPVIIGQNNIWAVDTKVILK